MTNKVEAAQVKQIGRKVGTMKHRIAYTLNGKLIIQEIEAVVVKP